MLFDNWFSWSIHTEELAQKLRVEKDLMEHIPAFSFHVLPFSWTQSLDLLTSRVSRLGASRFGLGRRALLATEPTLRQLFGFIDSDDKGYFTGPEFLTACSALFRNTVGERDAAMCFQAIDTGSRGRVDFKAWQQFYTDLQTGFENDDSLSLQPLLSSHLPVVERVVCQTFSHW